MKRKSSLDTAPATKRRRLVFYDSDDDPYATEHSEESSSIPEDEYEVDRILGHRVKGSVLEYEVKWRGYKETTFERVENLTNAEELLSQYHRSIGGDPTNHRKVAIPARSFSLRHKPAMTPVRSTEKEDKTVKFPTGNWESHVEQIVTLEKEEVGDKEQVMAYIVFNDAKYDKCRVPLKQVRQRCPKALLDFLIERLHFEGDSM